MIKIDIPAGKYVVAVSGGVDSVVLLDLLAKQQTGHEFIVAHFDHGMRKDSHKDAEFVKELATKYKLPFELGQGELGSKASEAEARAKRYDFLKKIQTKYKAKAIITAHHQDDLIETSIINILRGTGRRGLTSLKNRSGLIRPLLEFSKQQLIEYAKKHHLKWHEDSTNKDTKILRNKVRHTIVPKMDDSMRTKWLQHLKYAEVCNEKLDKELEYFLQKGLHKGQLILNRRWFTMLPHAIAKEVLLTALYKAGASDMDKATIERLSIQIKTLPGGKTLQAPGIDIMLTKRSARFNGRIGAQKKV